MSWVQEAAARRGIPLTDEFSTVRLHFPAPTRWGRCEGCGSTVWNLGREGRDAADAMAVHSAFCRKGK